MTIEPTRIEAKEKLTYFIEEKLINYSKLRNFKTDIKDKSTTSNLSPYITHGILSEKEVIKECLKKHSYITSEKFIQEILWRIYWKGWLEIRPQVWKNYLKNLTKLENEFKDNRKYIQIIEGNSNIECFNDWIKELKESNYLHNHARMWFASIWIFTFNLPWELGAAFFMKYLYDGDIASNTLSWRWVAGIQTKGKHYLAKEWNIRKFTNEKYKKIEINENALPIKESIEYSIMNKELKNQKIEGNKKLLIFENNLSFENSEYNKEIFEKILIVRNNNRNTSLTKKVLNFKNNLINDQLNRLNKESIDCDVISINDIKKIKENIYIFYPCVGDNLDLMNLNDLTKIKFLYREIDLFSWQYCHKGFFNFKNYIPKIIQKFC
ncbi:DNA photolyase [Alphaproteobacteria bacterium]|nr:DNA photolyase [Alphaproteobacteria bacterium]